MARSAPRRPPHQASQPDLRLLRGGPDYRDGVYLRVSAVMGREDDRFLSPDLQQEAIDRARAASGAPSSVVEIYKDIDVSGTTMDRPDLNRALQDARDGRIDRLWVYDLSRWARVADDGLRELKRIQYETRASVMSASENIDITTPEGYMAATMLLAAHEYYSKKIGQRWRETHDYRSRKGEHHGVVPTGYYRAIDDTAAREGRTTKRGKPVTSGRPLIHPEEGPRMRRAFEMYAQDHKMADIAKAFNRGRPHQMSQQHLRELLQNPFYAGKVVRHYDHGTELFDGMHEPLIDEDTWQKAQRRTARDTQIPSRTKARVHPLVGLLRCGDTDHALVVHGKETRKDLPEPIHRLTCVRQRDYFDCQGCGRPFISDIEAKVLEEVRAYVARLTTNAIERQEALARRTRAAVDAERLQRELDRTQEARARLAIDKAKREITDDAFKRADASLADDETRLQAQIAELDDIADNPLPTNLNKATQLLKLWPHMTSDEKHLALRAVVKAVRVRRANYYRESVANRTSVEFI